MATTSYRLALSEQAEVLIWFVTERGRVVSYAVVLIARHLDDWKTVRVYDNAHGENEMHRHTLSAGKQLAEPFHMGAEPGEAMRAARQAVLAGHATMIEAWRS